nr:VENN motif pre-toxin domain-containing protein [Moraxella sp. HMSC061H09]
MWGDYQVDDPNTLTQAQKDKLINQAKLIAGITAAFAGEDVNVAAGVAAEAGRWNATYKNKVRSIASLRREFSDNDKLLVSKIESGEIPFKKNVADYLFLINTDENLVLHVKFKEPIRVKLTRANEPWKNNKSVPGEETHSATTMVRNAEWAVLGNVTLSRPIGTEEYRIVPDEYDFDIKSWREYPIRNIATILGRPGNGKKFKIIPVGKVILRK